MQKRTSAPDQYSKWVKKLYLSRQAKRLSPFAFAAAIERVWALRTGQ